MKEKYKSIVILIIGMMFWMTYLYDSEMSRYGIYSIFNYNTHEILSAIPFISITITILWIFFLLRKSFTERKLKSNKVFCSIFIVLFISQTIYLINKGNTVTTAFVTSIDKINRDTMEIIIHTDEYELTLDCPMIVLDLLKSDGTKYGIMYESNKKNPSYGKLCNVKAID